MLAAFATLSPPAPPRPARSLPGLQPTLDFEPEEPSMGLCVDLGRARLRMKLLGEPLARVRVGRYLVHEQIGAGAMGTVYRAWDGELQRDVALKIIEARRGEPARRRALAEARGLACVAHEAVVSIVEVGEDERRIWIAMDYVDGQTLGEWTSAAGRSRDEILERYLELGAGLAAVHAAGLVHRDVKPDNVLVARDGSVRLVDFGLVCSVRDTISIEGVVIPASGTLTVGFLGTPAYAAPEQLRGQFDGRSDQYSFCAALWEALCGQRPDHATRGATGRVPLPADVELAPALWAALSRGLSCDPELRFADMDELLTALAAAR